MLRTRGQLIAIALILVACKREQMHTASRVTIIDPDRPSMLLEIELVGPW